MRLLISALTSLSILGGASAPLVYNMSPSLAISPSNNQRLEVIYLSGSPKIYSEQGGNSGSINFQLDLKNGEKIESISFAGEGLRSIAYGGSDSGTHTGDKVPVGQTIGAFPFVSTILLEEHGDFLSNQVTRVSFDIAKWSANTYNLSFHHFTKSSAFSFSKSWGELAIGPTLTLLIN